MTFSHGPIKIKGGERLCKPVSDILVLTSALAYSTIIIQTGSIPNHDPKLGFSIPCEQYPFSIKMPIFGVLEALFHNEPVVEILLNTEPRADTGKCPNFEIGNVLLNIVSPIFAAYYERQAEWLTDHVSTDPNQWPMLFRFARIVRNAVVHFGVITFRNPNSQTVSWKGLAYSPADNGRLIYPHDINTGDFLALMIEIDHEMNSLGAPAL